MIQQDPSFSLYTFSIAICNIYRIYQIFATEDVQQLMLILPFIWRQQYSQDFSAISVRCQ